MSAATLAGYFLLVVLTVLARGFAIQYGWSVVLVRLGMPAISFVEALAVGSFMVGATSSFFTSKPRSEGGVWRAELGRVSDSLAYSWIFAAVMWLWSLVLA